MCCLVIAQINSWGGDALRNILYPWTPKCKWNSMTNLGMFLYQQNFFFQYWAQTKFFSSRQDWGINQSSLQLSRLFIFTLILLVYCLSTHILLATASGVSKANLNSESLGWLSVHSILSHCLYYFCWFRWNCYKNDTAYACHLQVHARALHRLWEIIIK